MPAITATADAGNIRCLLSMRIWLKAGMALNFAIVKQINDIAPLAYSLTWPLPISRNCTSLNSAGTQRCQASVHTNHLLRPQEPSSNEYLDVHSKQQRKAEVSL